jgi:hypothetical protein
MDYMHGTFPTSKGHEHGAHLSHEHNLTHEDAGIRERTEPHSVEGGGIGTLQVGVGGRGTI